MSGQILSLKGLRASKALACLALAFYLVRAILPQGWMPSASAEGVSIVICTLAGQVHVTVDGHGNPVAPDHSNTPTADHTCPFAAAPNIASLSTPIPAPRPHSVSFAQTGDAGSVSVLHQHRWLNRPSRAPPSIA